MPLPVQNATLAGLRWSQRWICGSILNNSTTSHATKATLVGDVLCIGARGISSALQPNCSTLWVKVVLVYPDDADAQSGIDLWLQLHKRIAWFIKLHIYRWIMLHVRTDMYMLCFPAAWKYSETAATRQGWDATRLAKYCCTQLGQAPVSCVNASTAALALLRHYDLCSGLQKTACGP